jgi:hypothetical protein
VEGVVGITNSYRRDIGRAPLEFSMRATDDGDRAHVFGPGLGRLLSGRALGPPHLQCFLPVTMRPASLQPEKLGGR